MNSSDSHDSHSLTSSLFSKIDYNKIYSIQIYCQYEKHSAAEGSRPCPISNNGYRNISRTCKQHITSGRRQNLLQHADYHSCFISYAHQDEALAQRLHTDLQSSGVHCWFAPHDMRIGARIRPTIDEAIQKQDKLLLLLSTDSIDSAWVEAEVEAAFEQERQTQREMLFPVRLDDSVMQSSQAWAANLRRARHIGDFTNWMEPQSYQRAIERLLRDLKKTEEQLLDTTSSVQSDADLTPLQSSTPSAPMKEEHLVEELQISDATAQPSLNPPSPHIILPQSQSLPSQDVNLLPHTPITRPPGRLRRPAVVALALFALLLLGGGSLYRIATTNGRIWGPSASPNTPVTHTSTTASLTWHPQNIANSHELSGVTWSPSRNLFVAIGDFGTILTSPDGINWKLQHVYSGYQLNEVIWSGSQFVAIGDSGTILTSPDGINWTDQISNTQDNLEGIAWSPSLHLFVIGADNAKQPAVGILLTSSDGISWKTYTLVTGQQVADFPAVAWSPALHLFVLIGTVVGTEVSGGAYYTSSDGSAWTVQTSAISPDIARIIWAGSQFVAVGAGGTILTSPDGIKWTSQSSHSPATLTDIAWSGSLFVTIGLFDTLLTSPDGIKWTAQTPGSVNSPAGIVWSESLALFVIVEKSGTILTSS
jgi:hypothetical protein